MTQRPGISHHFPLTTFAAEAVKSGLPRDPKEQREGEADHETRPGAVEFCHDLQTQQIFQLGVSENGAPSSGMAIFFPGDDSPECHGQKKKARRQAPPKVKLHMIIRLITAVANITLLYPGCTPPGITWVFWIEKKTNALWLWHSQFAMENHHIGKPSISMGHLYHGYVK